MPAIGESYSRRVQEKKENSLNISIYIYIYIKGTIRVYRVVYSQSETGNVPQHGHKDTDHTFHITRNPKPKTRNPKPSTNKNFKTTSCMGKGVEHYSTYYFVQRGFNFCASDCNYYSSRWSENPALERENGSTFPLPFMQQICVSQKREIPSIFLPSLLQFAQPCPFLNKYRR